MNTTSAPSDRRPQSPARLNKLCRRDGVLCVSCADVHLDLGITMFLEGSCHCRAVRFSVESREPVPFMRCYCSICRKTAGTGGFAINLGADHATLKVDGSEHVSIYRAVMEDGRHSSGQRHFCKQCGSALWLWDPSWPDLVHPHAGAIDTPLLSPPSVTHIMLGSKPAWVEAHVRPGDQSFDAYPKESLAEWHRRQGVGGWQAG